MLCGLKLLHRSVVSIFKSNAKKFRGGGKNLFTRKLFSSELLNQLC